MTEINYANDKTLAQEKAQGSDGRLNVSSRSDNRSYYVSRDTGLAYSVVFDDADCDQGDVFFWLKNDNVDKAIVIDSIGINGLLTGSFKLQFETATLTGGSALTPTNLNRTASHQAVITCRGNGLLSTSASGGTIDQVSVAATAHEEFRLADRVRLGQGDAISLLYDRGADNNIVEGVVFFYYE